MTFLLIPVLVLAGSIGYPSVEAALAGLRADPGASFRTDRGWTIVEVKTQRELSVWSFTPEGHPAHPAAVKRTLVEQNGKVMLHLTALCEASKQECVRLIEQFQGLTEQIKREIRDKGT